MINKVIYRFLFIGYLFSRINWLKLFRLYSKNSNNILWLHPSYPKGTISYLFGATSILHDFAMIAALLERNEKFCIVIGKNIGHSIQKNIYYTVSHKFNTFNLHDYASSLFHVVSQLEKQGNRLYPKSTEAQWWENKAFMHQKFMDLNIPHPKTQIIYGENEIDYSTIQYPILLKEVHSASSEGVHKVNNESALKELIAKITAKGTDVFLLQQLIDMRRDLRVTLIGDEIVLYYWRINQSKEWKPTSTGHGSLVDFEFFPNQWKTFIIENFRKLNITTGAFDVTWDGDDLNTIPLFLEVSPVYQPNPKIPDAIKQMSYAEYKKIIWGDNAYYKAYIDIVFDIKKKIFNQYF